MAENVSKCPIRAGEAFMRMIENDPAGNERLRRLQSHMKTSSEAVRLRFANLPEILHRAHVLASGVSNYYPDLRGLAPPRQQVFDELLEKIDLKEREREAHFAKLAKLIVESIRPTGDAAVSAAERIATQSEALDTVLPIVVPTDVGVGNTRLRDSSGKVRPKRSTQKGEARVKMVAMMTKHHRYSDECCMNFEPIGVNQLARLVDVARSTASDFFAEEFDAGYQKYRAICRDSGSLLTWLKALNAELRPFNAYGRNPPAEGNDCSDD